MPFATSNGNTQWYYSNSTTTAANYNVWWQTAGKSATKPVPLPICATCGHAVHSRDAVEHMDLHAQGL